MKKNLTIGEDLHYYRDGERINGAHAELTGDCTGILGDLNDCEITDKEREWGVDILDLVD